MFVSGLGQCKHTTFAIYMVRALLLLLWMRSQPAREEKTLIKLMPCKYRSWTPSPWTCTRRSVDKLPANAEKKLDKFFFPKVECTAAAVLCC